MPQIINLAELADFSGHANNEVCSNGDYILKHVIAENAGKILPAAIKMDGASIFLCTHGEVDITVNFRKVKLCPGCVMVLSPNDVVELVDGAFSDIEGYALFLPVVFLKQFSLDSNTLDYRGIKLDAPPVMQLDDKCRQLFDGYFRLLELNAGVNREPSVYTRNISRSLVGAMIYQLMAFARGEGNGNAVAQDDDKPAETRNSRRHYYVKDFMTLLQQDFRQHRSVGYYADKLFISAKYLSLIIKEATGRTATEWIDHFVILEAKNLLRYSGRNIQQIAYDLNFHNQSAFGKYFKHITGLSPSEFRKT